MRRLPQSPAPLLLLGLLAGCTDIGLVQGGYGGDRTTGVDGAGGNQGTTLPGPDMTLVTYASDPLAARLVIFGSPGAVAAAAQVQGINETTEHVDTTIATDEGAFVLGLGEAHPGDDVSLVVADGSDSSAPVNLELDLAAGADLPLPLEVRATVAVGALGSVELTGVVLGTAALHVRIANRVTGRIDAAESTGDGDRHPFAAEVPGDEGDVFLVSVFDPAHAAVAGRYVEVTATLEAAIDPPAPEVSCVELAAACEGGDQDACAGHAAQCEPLGGTSGADGATDPPAADPGCDEAAAACDAGNAEACVIFARDCS